jgi:CubicO group peptidase (beta-lactamase class C family)
LTRRRWGLLLLIGVVATALVAPAARALSRPREDVAAIDGYVRKQMARHRIPGLALAITKGDQVTHVRGFGTAGGQRPVTAETPFYIGSVSKSFTALAVMQLVEAGEIELDAPVRRYIPWFTVADEAASQAITVRHLLHQTSGLSDAGFRRRTLPADATLEETVRDLRRAELTAPVGTTYQYFNLNYNVLGLIIEEVSGQSYGAYLKEHILAPLGMESTFLSQEAAEQADLAQGHNVVLGFPVAREQPYLAYDLPAGMIIASAADMARYAIAQTNDGCLGEACILSAEGIETLHTPPADVDSPYAMGWEVHEDEGLRRVSHNGAVRTFFSSITLLPEEGYGVVLLVNQNSIFHLLLAYERVVDGVVRLLVGRQPPGGIAMATLYAVIAAVIALDLARHGLRLARLSRWRRRWEARGSSRRTLVGLGVQALVALLILVGIPLLLIVQAGTDGARVTLFNYAPAISTWLGLSSLLTLIEVGIKTRWVLD